MTKVSQEAREAEVTQADREAAADLYLALDGGSVEPSDIAYANTVRQGRCDDSAAVQAFARHRQSAERGEVVKVGVTTPFDGSDGGFTIAVFNASEVPVGTTLYTLPTPPEAL